MAPQPTISVVIPTWQEAHDLPDCLASLSGLGVSYEIIVADGGSDDGTRPIAEQTAGVTLIRSPRGRAVQMNTGARVARGEILWFLHADCRAPAGAGSAICQALADPAVAGGAFAFALGGSARRYRVIEAAVALRSRWRRRPYGDQGLFTRRLDFFALGGFRELPILEDLELVRALRERGRLVLLELPLISSPRRWEHGGLIATTLANQAILWLHRLGVSPHTLRTLRDRWTAAPPRGAADDRPRVTGGRDG